MGLWWGGRGVIAVCLAQPRYANFLRKKIVLLERDAHKQPPYPNPLKRYDLVLGYLKMPAAW